MTSHHHRQAVIRYSQDLRSMRAPIDMLDALDATVRSMGLFALDLFYLQSRNESEHYRLDQTWFGCRCKLSDKFWRAFEAGVRKHGLSTLTRYARVHKTPFTFSECMRAMKPNGGQRWVFDLFRDHRIRDGYYYPANNRWMVTLHSPKVLRLPDEERELLNFACHSLAHRVNNVLRQHQPPLSARQYAVLERLAHGDSPDEIAKQLHMTKLTVREHVRRAKLKLAAKNSTHAAVIAANMPAPRANRHDR